MSSYPESPSPEDLKIIEVRKSSFKSAFVRTLLTRILPEMLLQDDFTAIVDTVYEIDRRVLVSESLRELADMIDTKYTIEDIKGGYCGEYEEP
jgi:hypothetical protein